MVRMLGVLLITAGFVIFVGNFSGAFRLYPGVGVLTVIIGGIIFALSDRFDTLPPGSEE